MKNSLESIAVFLVAMITLGIVALIVWFSFIDDKIVYNVPTERVVTKKEKVIQANDYLSSLEGYEDDDSVDNSSDDASENTVKVFTGDDDEIDNVVSDKSKSTYLQNLENYEDEPKKKKESKVKETKNNQSNNDESGQAAFINEIGSELDDLLGGL